MRPDPDQLGAPDLSLAGLHFWVHGRQFPKAFNPWDGNWLDVTIHCEADGASVWAWGNILEVTELVDWVDQCASLHRELRGQARLATIEPHLSVDLSIDRFGKIAMTVRFSQFPVCF